MAGQTLKREYADIKAGVEGSVGQVPSTSEIPEPPSPTGFTEELPDQPGTDFIYNSKKDYNEEPNQEQDFDFNSIQPSPSNFQPRFDESKIHEITEAIVNERWEELMSSIGNIAIWKERTDSNILSMKQEIIRANNRVENMQNAILGKVKDYDEGLRNVGTEMRALEKVFERILEPMTSNIKELERITQELKRIKKN